MYLFSFKQFAGHDRVFSTSLCIGKPGDLLKCGDDYLLNLGNEISFPELIKTQFMPTSVCEVIYPGFFDEKFLSLLHWMVYQWYSTYNNVMKYFISFETQQLLSREPKSKAKDKALNIFSLNLKLDENKQNLIIIPDNWSRKNQLSDYFSQEFVLNLYSMDTQTNKDKNWRTIKKSKTGIIVATQSEIFQPFNNLGTIVFIDGYKRYYSNQQDPRYNVSEVVKKLQELWNCNVINLENIGLIE